MQRAASLRQPWPLCEAHTCGKCGHVYLNLFDVYDHVCSLQRVEDVADSYLAGVTTGLSQALTGRATDWNNIWPDICMLLPAVKCGLMPSVHNFGTNPWLWNQVNDVMQLRGSNRMVWSMFEPDAARNAAANLCFWRARHLNVLGRDRDAWVYPVSDPASGQMVYPTWVYRWGDWWTYIWIDTSRRDGTAVVRKTGHFAWCRLGQNSWVEWGGQLPTLSAVHLTPGHSAVCCREGAFGDRA